MLSAETLPRARERGAASGARSRSSRKSSGPPITWPRSCFTRTGWCVPILRPCLRPRAPRGGGGTNGLEAGLKILLDFAREEDGQGLSEYALVLVLVSTVVILALTYVADATNNILNEASTAIVTSTTS